MGSSLELSWAVGFGLDKYLHVYKLSVFLL